MAGNKYKKLQVGPAVSFVDANLGIKIDDKDVGSGSGKIWTEFELTPAIINELERNYMVDFKLDKPYNPENFENDYFKATQKTEGARVGTLVSAVDPLHKLYIDFVNVNDWCNANVQKDFIESSSTYGFIHQNYKMGILYAKSDGVNFVRINAKYLEEAEAVLGVASLVNSVSSVESGSLSGWTESDTCPFEYEIKPGTVVLDYTIEKTYLVCYRRLSDEKYFYTAATSSNNFSVFQGPNLMFNKRASECKQFVDEVEVGHAPTMENANPMNEYNIVYIADVTRQPWDLVDENSKNPGIDQGGSQLEYDIVGKQYAISIHGKNTKVSYLMVFEDGEMSIVNPDTHAITSWEPVDAGQVYHITWDATANRFSLGAELTAAQKQALYSTGIEFDSPGGAMYVRMTITEGEKTTALWTGEVVANSNNSLKYVLSADEPFKEPTEFDEGSYIARPIGFYLSTYTSFDHETQTYKSHKSGQYVWECTVANYGSLLVSVPLPDDESGELDTCTLRLSSSEGALAIKSLYRHTFKLSGNVDDKFFAISMFAVNNQNANASTKSEVLNYLINSDTSTGWELPASGGCWIDGTHNVVVTLTNMDNDGHCNNNTLYAYCFNGEAEATRIAICTLNDANTLDVCSDTCIYLGSVSA